MTSLSRAGRLSKSQIQASSSDGANPFLSQISQIQWKKANVFDPESYKEELESADAVVHSMGILFQDDRYKNLINGKLSEGPISFACGAKDLIWNKFFGKSSEENANPLKRSPTSGESHGGEQSMFQKINRDSAVILGKAFAETPATPADTTDSQPRSDKPFVYISAEDHSRFTPAEYISSKRSAEAAIDLIPGLRGVYLRPGFMVDNNQPSGITNLGSQTVRDGLGHILKLKYNVASALGASDEVAAPVLDVQSVAKAAIEALDDDSLRGPISLAALNKYAKSL